MQCKGTTKRGERCKINTNSPSGFCKYHLRDGHGSSKGFIYAYTLRSFEGAYVYNHAKSRFEPLASGWRKLLFWRKPPKQMLVKVGFTTNTPEKRLDQWQKQCGHPLMLVTPRASDAPHYDQTMHGWPCSNAHSVENAVHAKLRAEYGRGQVRCSCKKEGVHIEWFLVPRKQVYRLCQLIDGIVAI